MIEKTLPGSEQAAQEQQGKKTEITFDDSARLKDLKKIDGLKLVKTTEFIKVIDPQRLISSTGDVYYIEGLHIPQGDDHDLKTKKFIEEHFIGKEVSILSCKKKDCKAQDRYGHERAHIVLKENDLWLQGALLTSGLAQIRTRNDWPFLIDEMQVIERKARADKIGMWESDALMPKQADSIQDSVRGFFIVEGIIKTVAMHKNKTYLNFGDNWRKDFTIVIPSDIRRKFSKKNIDIMNTNGRPVRVRGWVDAYNGPFIEIDHIEQIEWIEETKN